MVKYDIDDIIIHSMKISHILKIEVQNINLERNDINSNALKCFQHSLSHLKFTTIL